MIATIVRRPLNEEGRAYRPGEALLTTPERAARLAELGLVEVVAEQAPPDCPDPPEHETDAPAHAPAALSVETTPRALLRGRRGR